MRLAGLTIVLGLIHILTPTLSVAQGTPLRQGLWFGAGLGFGFSRARCDICTNDRNGGVSGQARLGGVDVALGALHAVGYWYPSPRGTPWFLKGGFGIVGYRIDDGANDPVTATSFGGQFGAGYDLRVARNVALTPHFTLIGSLFANLESAGDRLADVSLTLVQFGMGVTFY
jgi:hypothetical protein